MTVRDRSRRPPYAVEPDEPLEDLVVEVDPDGVVRHTSRPAWAGAGSPRIGAPLAGALALDGAALLGVLERTRRSGGSERVVGRLVGAGELMAVAGRVIPRDGAAGFRGWLLVLHPDVDLATRLLEASPGILIRAVEQMSLGVTLCDGHGRIVYANRAEAEMHGFSPDELIGRPVAELGAPGATRPPSAGVSAAPWVRTRANRRKDGSIFPVRLISDELRDEERLLGRVTISEDISERARLERMKEDFVRVVGHELRTPLTSILASLALLRRSRPPDDREREALAIVERNSRHLFDLVEDLLDLQNAVSGSLEIAPEPVPVAAILHEVAERAAEESPGRPGLDRERIVVAADPELSEPGATVRADRRRLLQVLDQLVANALTVSPPAHPVRLGAERGAESTRLTVTDRGPGIPDEFRRHLFEPFTQADASTTRPGPGPGLGLSLAKALVERMGGELEVERARPTGPPGTTVAVRLPNG